MDKVTYFDVEYANSKNKSICQIGIICENFSSGECYFQQNIYVNPEDGFDDNSICVHGITEDKVKNKPNFPEVWNQIEKYFIDTIVIGHNVASSDLDALVKCLRRYDLDIPQFRYICTYELASKTVPKYAVANYRQATLCDYFDINKGVEHCAFDDTRACRDLFKQLVNKYDIIPNNYVRKYKLHETTKFRRYISKSDKLNRAEQECSDYDAIFTPLENLKEQITSIEGKHICLSGNFTYGSKLEVMYYIAEHGGIIDSSTKKSTDILIIGDCECPEYSYGTYGQKAIKAMEYNEKGCEIKIIKESDFFSLPLENKRESVDVNSIMNTITGLIDQSYKDSINFEYVENPNSYDRIVIKPQKTLYRQNVQSEIPFCRVVQLKEATYLSFPPACMSYFKDKFEITETKADKYFRIPLSDFLSFSETNPTELSDILTQCLLRSFNFPGFGCCSRYKECSEAKKCIHPDLLYATACSYRKNLEQGKIFY